MKATVKDLGPAKGFAKAFVAAQKRRKHPKPGELAIDKRMVNFMPMLRKAHEMAKAGMTGEEALAALGIGRAPWKKP